MNRTDTPGFTMVELAITLVVIGIIFTFSIPAYQNLTQSNLLHGATANMAAQMRLAREKAIATGVDQPMKFQANTTSSDYRILLANGQVPAKWKLPKGITYYGMTVSTVTLQKDGRASTANTIVLRDQRGNRDTVSVLVSGLVLTK
jgi:prepilin-type N-terminal cleavage/methylation domain-containing protein